MGGGVLRLVGEGGAGNAEPFLRATSPMPVGFWNMGGGADERGVP
jgi:hypothetical protein